MTLKTLESERELEENKFQMIKKAYVKAEKLETNNGILKRPKKESKTKGQVRFVVPIMRNIPVGIAKFAARRTAKYRWWAVNYIIGFFFVFPIVFFLLSLASSEAVTGKISHLPHVLTMIKLGHFSALLDCGTLSIDNCFDKYNSRD